MTKIKQKMETLGTFFFVLMFFAAGATVHTTATDVQADKNGFKQKKESPIIIRTARR